jgi:predicted nuclease of predicted toxin-antitoxin system
MKLLFDHNLSPTLVNRVADVFPGSNHVFYLDLDQSTDEAISDFAVAESFVIVTKDADYSEMADRVSPSLKIVWIRRGNCSTDAIEHLLRKHSGQINELSAHENIRLLMLF